MTDSVWLANKISIFRNAEVLGVFSDPGRAQAVCQSRAAEFYGAAHTPALTWLGNDAFRSASYYHPEGGLYLFQITQLTVDEIP